MTTKNKFGSIDLAYNYIIEHFAKGRRYFDFNTSSETKWGITKLGLLFEAILWRALHHHYQHALETKKS